MVGVGCQQADSGQRQPDWLRRGRGHGWRRRRGQALKTGYYFSYYRHLLENIHSGGGGGGVGERERRGEGGSQSQPLPSSSSSSSRGGGGGGGGGEARRRLKTGQSVYDMCDFDNLPEGERAAAAVGA